MDMKCPMNPDDEESVSGRSVNGATTTNDGEVDFSEFEWMAEQDLEEFDRKVELELWEEQFIESCFEQMWREEESDAVYYNSAPPRASNVGAGDGAYRGPNPRHQNHSRAHHHQPQQNLHQRQQQQQQRVGGAVNGVSAHRGGQTAPADELPGMMRGLTVDERNDINQARTSTSKLNPNAAIFIPRNTTMPPTVDR